MLPKVILHNSVSMDGSLTGFEPNMGLHYGVAARYKPDVHLIGSNTIKAGLELFSEGVASEDKSDCVKPDKDPSLPYWVIPDTRGTLMGSLHGFRRFEFCRDVIVLVSDVTPREYLTYLDEREYDYHVVGEEHVDLKKSLILLSKKHGVKTVLADTGRILGNVLLDQNLVNEISLLVHPIIVGSNSYNMFANIRNVIALELLKSERLNDQYLWLVFSVKI